MLPPPQGPGKVVEPHFYFPAWSCGEMHPQTKLLMHNPGCNPRIIWTREEIVGALITLLSLAALAWLGFRQTREPTIRVPNQARGKR